MSQENVEIIRKSNEDFIANTSESDREAMLSRISAYWGQEIEWDASELPLPDLAGHVQGKEAMRGWWQAFLEAWETSDFDYELVDGGDQVVMLIDQRLRGRSTGIEVALENYALVNTFSDGLIVRVKLHLNQAEALEAAGLSE